MIRETLFDFIWIDSEKLNVAILKLFETFICLGTVKFFASFYNLSKQIIEGNQHDSSEDSIEENEDID